eukprot:1260476-Prymnesium_polylepis.1
MPARMGPQARSRTWGARGTQVGGGSSPVGTGVARAASHLLHGRLVRVGARLRRFQVAYHDPALPTQAHCVRATAPSTANRTHRHCWAPGCCPKAAPATWCAMRARPSSWWLAWMRVR